MGGGAVAKHKKKNIFVTIVFLLLSFPLLVNENYSSYLVFSAVYAFTKVQNISGGARALLCGRDIISAHLPT